MIHSERTNARIAVGVSAAPNERWPAVPRKRASEIGNGSSPEAEDMEHPEIRLDGCTSGREFFRDRHDSVSGCR